MPAGTPCHITAGAVVLCSGGATGLFPTVSSDTDNVGNGLVLGLQAGAALANSEFVEYTLIYRVNHQLMVAISGPNAGWVSEKFALRPTKDTTQQDIAWRY